LIDAMPRKLPLYVSREKTRHGRVVYYFRPKHGKRIRLPDFGSPEFDAAYKAALSGQPLTPHKHQPGEKSLEWLIRRYMESGAWAGLEPGTRRQRELIFIQAIKTSGAVAFSRITSATIENNMSRRRNTPAAANNFLKAMSGLFKWAAKNGHVPVNPCAGIEKIKYKSEGFPAWTMEDMSLFCQKWPLGTKQHLAALLILTSGLRRGDVYLAGKQHLKGNVFSMQTAKTGAWITVEFSDMLLHAIDCTPTGDLRFLTTERGEPFRSKESFGNWLSKQCREAGIKKSAHGIRKLAATIAADDGATTHELMSQFGWSTVAQAETYTKGADRKRLGIASSKRVSAQIENTLARTLNPGAGKIANKRTKSEG